MSKKYKVILISGGFDPVHKGHIECIQNAKELADEVWVGLNNDSWLRRKKGKSFMKENERAFVMDNIKGVDWVYIMNPKIHNDDTHVISSISRHKWMRERGEWEKGIMDLVMVVIELWEVPSTEEDVCKTWCRFSLGFG